MWKLKPSPRTIKATEKYIASLDRKREELTEEQWKLFTKYIEGKRVAVPFLILLTLFCTIMACLYWHRAYKYEKDIIPNQNINISFNNQKESISLSPDEIEKGLNYIIHGYVMAGTQIVLAYCLLIGIIISLTLARIQNRKMHKILLSRPDTK